MAITSITRDWGTSGPNIVRLTAANTLAEVFATDYLSGQADTLATLNSGVWDWVEGDIVAVAASDGSEFGRFDGDDFDTLIQMPGGNGEVTLPVVSGDFTVFDGTLGALKDAGYSASDATKTKVVMANGAVVVGAIAKYTDTAGTIDDAAGTATNAGSIQAGASGTAGTFISFPATAANGTLIFAAANAGGAFNTTVSNATSVGQSQVVSIPDSGATTANFIVSKTTGTQHVTVGALQVDAGAISSGISTGGFVGLITAFPTTATSGSIALRGAVNGSGNFGTIISNSTTQAQAQVMTVPDVGAATGAFVVTPTSFVMKSVAGAAAAGGAAAQSFTDAFCTSGSCVMGNWNTQANAVSVLKIVPGNGSFVVTSSGDAGVGTFNYHITKVI